MFVNATQLFRSSKTNSFNLVRSFRATSKMPSKVDLREIFVSGVKAVMPKSIFRSENFRIVRDETKTNREYISCSFNDDILVDISGKKCHLVGFGKGVFGMAQAIHETIGDRLKSGILSVPFGTQDKFPSIELPKCVEVFEGAKDNLPDEAAMSTAKKILAFTRTLDEHDVLIVLITGGGSALLPLPCDGVSLVDKCSLIKQLMSRGVDIGDVNRVRTDLSLTKGGKLAESASNAANILTLIVSDVIGDPIELIASGPTAVTSKQNASSIDVLKRVNLWNTLSPHLQDVIAMNSMSKLTPPKNVRNLLVANNKTAIKAAAQRATDENQLKVVVLSSEIDGTVSALSRSYVQLALTIREFQSKRISKSEFQRQLSALRSSFHADDHFEWNLIDAVEDDDDDGNDHRGLCVIGGGEPTVEVTGNGVGGRNQELTLRFARECFHHELLHDVQLLSAGTDGIDGPTTAAGAIGSGQMIEDFGKQHAVSDDVLDRVDTFILENDSFRFYEQLKNDALHIVTGHTGTNVMDLHILYFPPKIEKNK